MSHLQRCGYATEELPLGDDIALSLALHSPTVDSKAWGDGCISGETRHRRVAPRRAAFRSCPSCGDGGEAGNHPLLCPTIAYCTAATNVFFFRPFLPSPVGFLHALRAADDSLQGRRPRSCGTAEERRVRLHCRSTPAELRPLPTPITMYLCSYFNTEEKIMTFMTFNR